MLEAWDVGLLDGSAWGAGGISDLPIAVSVSHIPVYTGGDRLRAYTRDSGHSTQGDPAADRLSHERY
jgi:hypothetical protein